MTAAILDLTDSIAAKVAGIVPAIRSGVLFRERLGAEPLGGSSKDTGFERAFRVTPGGPRSRKTFGGATCEVEADVLLEVGYLSGQDDVALRRQIFSDVELIHKALQSSSLTWPVTMANIVAADKPRVVDLGQGSNVAVLSWVWRVTYDVG
jgi:hypothetical protein